MAKVVLVYGNLWRIEVEDRWRSAKYLAENVLTMIADATEDFTLRERKYFMEHGQDVGGGMSIIVPKELQNGEIGKKDAMDKDRDVM